MNDVGQYVYYAIEKDTYTKSGWILINLAYYPIDGEYGAYKNLDRDYAIMRHGSASVDNDYSTSVFHVLGLGYGSFDEEIAKRCLLKLRKRYSDERWRIVKVTQTKYYDYIS